MSLQSELIGQHPTEGLFFEWLKCEDTECTDKKRHRYLSERNESKEKAIETVANWLVLHHLSKSKKELLSTKLIKNHVERNMSSTNKNFIFISLGMDNPVDFMEEAFKRAEELVMGAVSNGH